MVDAEAVRFRMNILIDTNVIIPLEDTSRTLDPSLAEMSRLAKANGHLLHIHPAQKQDVQRDKNEERRNIVLSRLELYQQIPSPPELTDLELSVYGWRQRGDNDRIDNLLLHALCRGAIHLLVTNDKGIHKKARKSQVQEQVHYVEQFLVFLRSQVQEDSPPPYGICEQYLHEFNVHQPFFDSLREGYSGFDDWYLNAATEQRRAWCISDNTVLKAICIFKVEDSPVIIDGGEPLTGRVLKLCTFKVGHEVRGRKLGERMLFSAFQYAVEHEAQFVYLHTFGIEHEMLVTLCKDYGFECVGKYRDRDDVYLKEMTPPKKYSNLAALDYAIKYYPNYIDESYVAKFIVPIKPDYHNDLFADISDTSRGLFADDPLMYSPQSNTIKKAYICHANTSQIQAGDLLLFYRSHDRQSIECIGVVEQTYRGRDINKVVPMVSKRTVFSSKQIEILLSKKALVILFRLLKTFPPIENSLLAAAEIKQPIQSIRKIEHDQYLQCFKKTSSDE
jgi:hypothetical protein